MRIRSARVEDAPIILQLIKELADFERAPDEVEATEKEIIETIFAEEPKVFCEVVEADD